ncbi:NADP-dependent aldehyde dehydrogenase [Nocardioides luteus]|uniref:2,5-dioxovalerate dehydrogenase n=1 Tax=Nocardioides luteus TaxID=1844 RepID=A0ABQ5T212_9ACTN|nr:aldehyde dehydrogenase (NADP(+)) [Nocardioides luteus]MDR7311649.1 NADP-dependent aldehyde dehydrogenase [Nocardioides luteus]GGR54214.1 2,5-dioxovalerate dehydrogenase [Nocardioides luteus]GLJ70299.1 2,5-dioxovalerate dehydrogenase [Nocardioides luteus]
MSYRSIIAGADADQPDVAAATTAAAEAFAGYRATTPDARADFLEAAAAEIEAAREEIVEAAVAESHLPEGRISGEVGRTTGQLKMFAGVVRRGDHLGVRIDPALPDRTPLPRADIRQRHIPLGPVAVFGASNFPLAFSTAGGDTASALAAGCPVVVKGHPAHPLTGYLVAQAITRAVEKAGLHAGTFSFLLDTDPQTGIELGQTLVTDPRIKAVGFTGSRGGGLAIVAAAATRPEPIPVYAEMSSINPVVVLPGALENDTDALATAYVGSLTLGSGQFCTNPGLLFLPTGEAGDAFLAAAGRATAEAVGTTMLTSGIASAYEKGTAALREVDGVTVVGEGTPGDTDAPAPQLVEAVRLDGVTDEVFGASGVVVRYDSVEELLPSLDSLEGQLTATVHATDADNEAAARVVGALELKAGRILFNGWPTGVEVGHAMVHGGPFPATSDSRSTSVGSLAIERFQRPVAYQDVPAALLPEAVRDDNPWQLVRRIDGELQLP